MSKKMLLSQSPLPSSMTMNKRQSLLRHNHSSTSTVSTYSYASNVSSCSGSFAEVAGGTTAECAAVCCCCPCGLVNLLFLTIYKVPAGLCRRALRRKRRRQLIKKGLLLPRTRRCQCGCDDTEIQIHPVTGYGASDSSEKMFTESSDEEEPEKEAIVKLEKEMWETFYGTGFWRSPSQREQVPPPSTPTKRNITSPRGTTPKAIDKIKQQQLN